MQIDERKQEADGRWQEQGAGCRAQKLVCEDPQKNRRGGKGAKDLATTNLFQRTITAHRSGLFALPHPGHRRIRKQKATHYR